MGYMKVSTDIKGLTKTQQLIRKSISRLVGDIAYYSFAEIRRQIPTRFRLRRQWIVQGIRFQRPKGDGHEALVYSLDHLMEKHEFGSSFNNRALVQSRFLQDRGRKQGDTPKELLKLNKHFFKNERGLFQRVEGKKLRPWYRYTFHRSYHERLRMRESVKTIASRMSNEQIKRFVIQ